MGLLLACKYVHHVYTVPEQTRRWYHIPLILYLQKIVIYHVDAGN